MAKTKTADNEFEPGEWYLCRIISARLTSHPTVDPADSGLMVEVQLSALVRQRVDDGPQIFGRQAVVFIADFRDRATFLFHPQLLPSILRNSLVFQPSEV
jgi:hypothetical protein